MLGWEYPPKLTGGLGQACYGIASALAEVVDLTLIIPKKDPASILPGGKIIGLNELNFEDSFFIEKEFKYESFAKVKYIPAYFDIYPISNTNISKVEYEERCIEIETKIPQKSKYKEVFNEENIYGINTMEKVMAYTKVVVEFAESMDFDIIHAHDWITFLAAMELKHKFNKPFVAHIHSLEIDRVGEFAKSKIFEIEKSAMEAANYVFPVSFYTRDCILKYYNVDIEKIFPIHNGIDHKVIFKRRNKKKKSQSKEKKILFLGRLTRQKGASFLVETAVQLLQKSENIKFIIAGNGDRLREIMQYAIQRGVKSYFEFHGFLDKKKVQEIMLESDVYFMPSISEPFGLAALEAVSHDLPVVASHQAGVTEVLPDILKANFWDTGKFANYLYALLNYKGLKKDLIKLNSKNISNITWTKSAEDIFFYYNKLAR